MKWTREMPTKPGAYWHRNKDRHEDPSVRMLRLYGGEIAWDNSTIADSPWYECSEWAGPIPEPVEQEARGV